MFSSLNLKMDGLNQSMKNLIKTKVVTIDLDKAKWDNYPTSNTKFTFMYLIKAGIPEGSMIVGSPYVSHWSALTVPMIEIRLDYIKDSIVANNSVFYIAIGTAATPTKPQSIDVTISYI